MMNEIETLRNLVEDALGMFRAIEATHDDKNLRELAGNAYSEISGQLCELAASPDRQELQATGVHPAPCARFCEAPAFNAEIRQLKAHIAELEGRIAAAPVPTPAQPETWKVLPSPARLTGELLHETWPGCKRDPWEVNRDRVMWIDWADRLNARLAAPTGEPIQQAKD
jgi:hypothetical protein